MLKDSPFPPMCLRKSYWDFTIFSCNMYNTWGCFQALEYLVPSPFSLSLSFFLLNSWHSSEMETGMVGQLSCWSAIVRYSIETSHPPTCYINKLHKIPASETTDENCDFKEEKKPAVPLSVNHSFLHIRWWGHWWRWQWQRQQFLKAKSYQDETQI